MRHDSFAFHVAPVSVLRGGGDLIDTKFTDSADILRMCSMYQKFSIFVFNENV